MKNSGFFEYTWWLFEITIRGLVSWHQNCNFSCNFFLLFFGKKFLSFFVKNFSQKKKINFEKRILCKNFWIYSKKFLSGKENKFWEKEFFPRNFCLEKEINFEKNNSLSKIVVKKRKWFLRKTIFSKKFLSRKESKFWEKQFFVKNCYQEKKIHFEQKNFFQEIFA